MSEESDGQERALDPTDRRLETARQQGDIARSPDAQTAAGYLGLALALVAFGRDAAEALGAALVPFVERPSELAALMLRPGDGLTDLANAVAAAVAPALLLPALAVLVFLVASRGVVFAPGRLAPKLSRLSPIENAKQRYGTSGLVDFLKASLKMALLLLVLAIVLAGLADRLGEAVHAPARALPRWLELPLLDVLAGTLLVSLVLGTGDFLYQRHAHRVRLRMSREDLKREMRESEGDPETERRRQDRARSLANNRMMMDVPKAAVVITNPTHVAVALAWERAPGSAPRCVAKGQDAIAIRIKARAVEAGVPVREDPPTARALLATVDIGSEIEPEHYRAVAAAILFADALRRESSNGEDGPSGAPSGQGVGKARP
ncbi:MAG: EscU/YscU/HrcU family type III secretion system export apparatus switch protein [Pseudomonadota bacterium]